LVVSIEESFFVLAPFSHGGGGWQSTLHLRFWLLTEGSLTSDSRHGGYWRSASAATRAAAAGASAGGDFGEVPFMADAVLLGVSVGGASSRGHFSFGGSEGGSSVNLSKTGGGKSLQDK